MIDGVDDRPGTYVLILRVQKPETIQVGKLGACEFKAGYYGYVGSAFGPGGLQARIGHHLNKSRRPHWHVDYLRRRSAPDQIWWSADRKRCEHDWATVIAGWPAVSDSVKGFGASDCCCASHLFRFMRRPGSGAFRKALKAAGRGETVQALPLWKK